MIQTTLQIQFTDRPLRETQAWFIAGADLAPWLQEIGTWNVEHELLRLHPIPTSARDRTPCGVVVSAPKSDVGASSRCHFYGLVAERLYLPVEAKFFPEVSEGELVAMLSEELVYVWHPTSGLTAFEPHEVLSPADLLKVDPPTDQVWNRGQAGVAISRRIISLLPSYEASIDLAMEEGRDDIGTEKHDIDQLPPSPNEAKSGLVDTTSRQASRFAAGMVRWFAQQAPKNANAPTWIDRLEEWANQRISTIDSSLNAARNKELSRLVHLLETDPDTGLRFALPLAGDAPRGIATPSGRLTKRDLDYRSTGSGGGAADFWNAGDQYRLRLTAKYRELANREINLGRHRRAAYIYAELLGDHEAAAKALIGGQHWREAALIYRKRLEQPLDAARCYEQGGLWAEAIELYEELQLHVNAGDLYARLDQPESAAVQYRQAIQQYSLEENYLSAAKLLLTKLNEPDESLTMLSLGWPHSPQAKQCMSETFRTLKELGRHEHTLLLVADLRERVGTRKHDLKVADILADQATEYPDRRVKSIARDTTRTIAACHLPQATVPQSRQLLAAVARLNPNDRLLSRDCQRFLQQRLASEPAPVPRRTPRRRSPQLVSIIHLPEGIAWKRAIVCGKTIYVAGVLGDSLTVVRAAYNGSVSPIIQPWKLDLGISDAPIVLEAAPYQDHHLLVRVIGRNNLAPKAFVITDDIPEAVIAGSVRGLPSHFAAVARGQGTTHLLQLNEHAITLSNIGLRGEQLSSRNLHLPAFEGFNEDTPSLPIPMHVRSDTVYIALNNSLLLLRNNREPEYIPLSHTVRSMTGSMLNSRTRIAVTYEQGGSVLWNDLEGVYQESFASEMEAPVACFNRGGFVIAADRNSCEVYSTQNRSVKFEAEIDRIGFDPIAVLPGPRSDQFGIVAPHGEIQVYQIT